MELDTPRLRIETVRHDDADAIARLWASKRVTKLLGGPRNRAGVRRMLRSTADEEAELDMWAVRDKETGDVVGHCGLLESRIAGRDEVEIIYVIDWKHWGRGLATEAAAAILAHAWATGLTRVVALIDPANEASEKVARKLGMTLEGEVQRPSGPRRLYAAER